MKSTLVDGRGKPYGLGSLSRVVGKGKRVPAVDADSPIIQELQEQLKFAKSEIQELKEQHKSGLELLVKYLNQKDPDLPPWIQSLVPTAQAPSLQAPTQAPAQAVPQKDQGEDQFATPSTSAASDEEEEEENDEEEGAPS